MTSRLTPCLCPVCESKLDAASATNRDGATPQSGDVTICIYCTTVLAFTDDLAVEKIDIKSIEPELQDILAAMIVEIQDNKPMTLH
jgi:hypothetical protein